MPAAMVLSTLLAYLAVYAVLTVAYVAVIFYFARKAARRATPREAAATRAPPVGARIADAG